MSRLTPFAPGLWLVDGGQVSTAGFHYPTRMAVIRLEDGSLALWSPVALDADLKAEIDALGEVTLILPPNALHHLFLTEAVAAWPRARVFAPPGLRARRPDLAFDGDLDEAPDAPWSPDFEVVLVPGCAIVVEAVIFHRASRTVLFVDLIQQFDPGWFRGWRALVARLDLMTGDEPAVPRKFRLAFTDRRAARPALARIAAWPAERVLMAHGRPVLADGQAFIRRAFAWLLG